MRDWRLWWRTDETIGTEGPKGREGLEGLKGRQAERSIKGSLLRRLQEDPSFLSCPSFFLSFFFAFAAGALLSRASQTTLYARLNDGGWITSFLLSLCLPFLSSNCKPKHFYQPLRKAKFYSIYFISSCIRLVCHRYQFFWFSLLSELQRPLIAARRLIYFGDRDAWFYLILFRPRPPFESLKSLLLFLRRPYCAFCDYRTVRYQNQSEKCFRKVLFFWYCLELNDLVKETWKADRDMKRNIRQKLNLITKTDKNGIRVALVPSCHRSKRT